MTSMSFDELKNLTSGEVILPSDPGYADVAFSFKKDGHPAVVIKCKSKQDILHAIGFARINKMLLSVRSGGHSMIGASTNDGGVVIDLSLLNSIEVIDKSKGLVRIESGARWGDVAKELEKHGLAISSGDTNQVGVGGLTLGGGIGWMVRKYGLTIDSLVGAEIVTANGQLLHLSNQENADLFWAIRGGGGNFGVVTSFEFQAHPCKQIVGGHVMYDIADREKVVLGWVNYMKTAPEDLTTILIIMPGFDPKDPTPVLMISLCYDSDDQAMVLEKLQPLLQLGRVKSQDIAVKNYSAMLQDSPPRIPFTVMNNISFVKNMDERFVKAVVENFGHVGTPLIQLRSLGGAMARVKADETAFAHRNVEAMMSVATFIQPGTSDEQAIQNAQKAWVPVQPFAVGTYINFLTDSDKAHVEAAYPPKTYARLAKIKAQYDPENLFNQNINIEPAT